MEAEKRSVNIYLENNFSTTPIKFYGLPSFDKVGKDEWIEPILIGPIGNPSRQAQQDEMYFLNINIYSRIDPDSATANRKDIYRVYEIADDLKDILNKTHINFLDTDNTHLGAFSTKEPRLTELGVDEGLMGVNLRVELTLKRQ